MSGTVKYSCLNLLNPQFTNPTPENNLKKRKITF